MPEETDTGCATAASIIISNYNYAPYLAAAIDSALAVDWPELEVIVVDDGSTDGSRDIIRSYGTQVLSIFKINGGQVSAYEAGFARARGARVVFLDSDDLLDPQILREADAVWHGGVSKVQVQMRVIARDGQAVGSTFPPFYTVPTPEQIRSWVLSTSAYPTPPGSGNVFSRGMLEKILPARDSFDYAGDSYTLAAAPVLGDVVTVPKPLASYRVHGRNDGAMLDIDPKRFGNELRRAQRRFAYMRRLAEAEGLTADAAAINFSLQNIPYRVASFRLDRSNHPVAGDSVWRILRDAVTATRKPQGLTPGARGAILVWAVIVVLSPAPIARSLIRWRFVPAARPGFLRALLRAARSVR
jgi:glycosyltransferase involved in cell wall biosynthesis